MNDMSIIKIAIINVLICAIFSSIMVHFLINVIEKHSIHPEHGHGVLNNMSNKIEAISYKLKVGCSPEDSC